MRCDLFLPGLPEKRRRDTAAGQELEDLLAAAEGEARRAHPGVDVPAEMFFPYVAARMPDDRPVVKALGRIMTSDLYLACGCTLKLPAALQRFDDILEREVDLALAQLPLPGADLGDIKQQLRHRLLVGDDARIGEYAGRGDLRAWVKVVAVRDALQIRRKLKREVVVSEVDIPIMAGSDPELNEIKRMYRHDFKIAFEAALQALTPKQRNLLRHHFLHGLNIDEIGALYGVHRATVARWIAKTRDGLLDDTRERLMARLKSNHESIESLMALVRSNLDFSISRCLRDSGSS
jgi:RNA polymerase sigma-70 factor (ECF subfamily)